MIDRRREKLIHTIAFFAKKTKHCYKLKLFKLLYFMDFEHFRQTGRPVTGLDYFAWPMGPVPTDLCKEIDKGSSELYKFINFIEQRNLDPDFKRDKVLKIMPKISFDKKLFSKQEIKIMEKTVELYKNAHANDMTDISHQKNMPWDRVYNQENKKQGKIPYQYILDDSPDSISIEEAEEIENDYNEMKKMFG